MSPRAGHLAIFYFFFIKCYFFFLYQVNFTWGTGYKFNIPRPEVEYFYIENWGRILAWKKHFLNNAEPQTLDAQLWT